MGELEKYYNSGDIHLITFGAKSAISQETKNVTKKIIIGETSERFAKKALEIGAERYIPRKAAGFEHPLGYRKKPKLYSIKTEYIRYNVVSTKEEFNTLVSLLEKAYKFAMNYVVHGRGG